MSLLHIKATLLVGLNYSLLVLCCFVFVAGDSAGMSDSDEFEYESDDDPYGGAEEEVAMAADQLHSIPRI